MTLSYENYVLCGAIRVSCEDDAVNADITINDVPKGQCPVDIEIAVGKVRIRATKKLNEFQDNISADAFTLAAGTAKPVEVKVGGSSAFRATAIARMEKQVEASESAAEARRRAELADLQSSGDGAAMTRLGKWYKFGLTGPIDYKKSADGYKKGADADDPEAMYECAMLLREGVVVPKNIDVSMELLKKSTALGYPEAPYEIAYFLERGTSGFQINKQGRRLF